MKSCIYARESGRDRSHDRTSIANQVAFGKALARTHNLVPDEERVYLDVGAGGDWLPTCWGKGDDPVRPALSAMIEAIEAGNISRVVVHRLGRLGTTSELLCRLLEFFDYHDVWIIADPGQTANSDDPREQFALSILRPRVQFDTDAECEKCAKLKGKKLEELGRLKARIARLEDEIAAL